MQKHLPTGWEWRWFRGVKGSYRIARVAGIDVRIHVTFLLLLAFYAWSYYETGGVAGAVIGVSFMLALFFCVLLHEFGHAFAARRFGIRTPDITLLPIGGVARLERMPSSPWQELVIAVAGPAVNVGIAIVLVGILGGVSHVGDFISGRGDGGILEALLFVNVMLIAFNMIPAFPMDGGRVLRALLATRMEHARATLIAARVGQAVAVGFGVWAVTSGNFILLFIALFVFMGAQQELAYARFRQQARGLRVGQVMNTTFRVLPIGLRVGEVEAALARDAQKVFPFVDDRLLLRGIANREELHQASRELPPDSPVSCVVRQIPVVHPDTTLSEAMDLMQRLAEPVVPVVNPAGQIVGLAGGPEVG